MSGPAFDVPRNGAGDTRSSPMPPGRVRLARALAVVAVTGSVWMGAACSNEDTVDAVPPPWPTSTVPPDGPMGVPQLPAPTFPEFSTLTVQPSSPGSSASATAATGTVAP